MEKQINSKTIFTGRIFSVTKDQVLTQDGMTAEREVVYHRGGVCILAIEDGCILLVRQFRYPNRVDTIEIPAGKLEVGENPDLACYREFEEETNRRADHMVPRFKILPTPGYCSEILHIYEAESFREVNDALPQDEDEFIDLLKIPVKEAYQMVLDGKIVDSKTVIAIMYAYNRLLSEGK
ncbi:MAG: NUDIX hydrolase [bacterium]